jgi:conjugative transfer signal peptidase TraF
VKPRGKVGFASATACAGAVLVIITWWSGLRGIASESMPRGLYTSEALAEAPARGDTVEVCLPTEFARIARERRYLSAGIFCPDGVQRIVKGVLAVPGDTVVVTPHGFVVDGVTVPNTRALQEDSRGRPLHPVPPGRYPVSAGTVWLFSTEVPNSYDSRYYGPIPRSALRRRFHPLWTEPHPASPVVFSRR